MTEIKVHGHPIDYAANDWLPEHIREGMQRYIERRIKPGSFLQAVLANDLRLAVGYADPTNLASLVRIVLWLTNCAPPACFGSPEKVKAWLAGKP